MNLGLDKTLCMCLYSQGSRVRSNNDVLNGDAGERYKRCSLCLSFILQDGVEVECDSTKI